MLKIAPANHKNPDAFFAICRHGFSLWLFLLERLGIAQPCAGFQWIQAESEIAGFKTYHYLDGRILDLACQSDLQQKLQQNDTGKLWNDSGRLVNEY